MNKITIHEWSEQQFRDARKEWNSLLERSSSDPLFLSWEWQHTWWQTFADPDQMQLQVLVAIDNLGKLVGIAPLYLTRTTSKKFIITRRLQFIGNCWRGGVTMRTELLDFIADKTVSHDVVKAFYAHLQNLSTWDELILTDLKKESDTYNLLIENQLLPKCYYRHAEEYDSFFVATTESFSNYVKSLGKNTRLRLFNRRKILEQLGDVRFESNQEDKISHQFKLLNQLHARRWGSPVFQEDRLKFNQTVANLMSQRDALRFSTLSIDNKPVSIQYNYVINNYKYNIQAGFNEDIHKKLALGYLHFGYEIEHACNNKITGYDFLAGEGKNTSYKERLTKSSIRIVDLQIIRNPFVKALYRLYDNYYR